MRNNDGAHKELKNCRESHNLKSTSPLKNTFKTTHLLKPRTNHVRLLCEITTEHIKHLKNCRESHNLKSTSPLKNTFKTTHLLKPRTNHVRLSCRGTRDHIKYLKTLVRQNLELTLENQQGYKINYQIIVPCSGF